MHFIANCAAVHMFKNLTYFNSLYKKITIIQKFYPNVRISISLRKLNQLSVVSRSANILKYTVHIYKFTVLRQINWKVVVRVLTFQTSSEKTKRLHQIISWFLGNDTKKWFLTNWGRDNKFQGFHGYSKFWRNFTVRWVRLWTSTRLWIARVNKRFKKHFCGHIHFKKLVKFWKFIEIFHCFMTKLRNKK